MKGSISSRAHYQLQEIKSPLSDLLQSQSKWHWADKGHGGCAAAEGKGARHSPELPAQPSSARSTSSSDSHSVAVIPGDDVVQGSCSLKAQKMFISWEISLLL